ncbi:MAG: hypothetical protein GY799_25255 [Desulfobulbaceae bacterium]|nr:hypothetical protein [Desulfobulbaceae bacterium]
MTKAELREHYPTDAAIARLFQISRAAVAMWKNDERIPWVRYLELRFMLRPDLFSESTDKGSR